MDLELPGHLLYGLMLYAETHYAFRYFGSLLRKREPEILADAPSRVEPNVHVPVLCLIKDANLYPVELSRVTLRVRYASGHLAEHAFPFNLNVKEPLWHTIVYFEPQESGPAIVDVVFTIRRDGRARAIHNDNYRTASHAPLRVQVSPEALPTAPGWYYGEPHCHTIYSSDQVEFGAPVSDTVTLAKAMGLRWMAVTDHSYDLDDLQDNPLGQDPALGLWRRMKADVQEANRAHEDFAVVAGEEVSCGNDRARNVHLLALGIQRFIEGSGDSAERWFRCRPEWTAEQVVEKVNQDGGAAYAAHPAGRTPFFQWLLIRRGQWSLHGLTHRGLCGLQVWNGDDSTSMEAGRARWIRLLLDGHKKYVLGASDAHGNFNRFRQIGIPFVTVRESDRHLFGTVRTGLFIQGTVTERSVLDALGRGRSIVTDGPFLVLGLKDEADGETAVGRTFQRGAFAVRIEGRTSEEFGEWDEIVLYQGDFGGREERTPVRWNGAKLTRAFTRDTSIVAPEPGYIRMEARTTKGHRCMTNPMWIDS